MDQPPSADDGVASESHSASEEPNQGIRDSMENTEADVSPILSDVGGVPAEIYYHPENQENVPLEQAVLVVASTSGGDGDSNNPGPADVVSDEDRTISSTSETKPGRKITQDTFCNFIINSNVYECKKCEILYKDAIIYRMHMITHLIETHETHRFKCKCSNVEELVQDFHVHLNKDQHNLNSYKEDEELLPWDLPYSINDARKLHWWNIRATDGLYMCPDCLIVYRLSDVAMLHEINHARKKEPVFNCICKEVFTNRVEFNRHIIEAHHPKGTYMPK